MKNIPDGYNVGFNPGRVAGQGVMHCHVHVIPRYHGDTDNPHGGVPGCCPEVGALRLALDLSLTGVHVLPPVRNLITGSEEHGIR